MQTAAVVVGAVFVSMQYAQTQDDQRVTRTIDFYKLLNSNPMLDQSISADRAIASAIRRVRETVLNRIPRGQTVNVDDPRIASIFRLAILNDANVMTALSANASFLRSVKICVESGACDQKVAIGLFGPSSATQLDNIRPIRTEVWESGNGDMEITWCWFARSGRLTTVPTASVGCPRF
jgi:hypothetical protein